MDNSTTQYITVDQAAKILELNYYVVYKWVVQKKLPSKRGKGSKHQVEAAAVYQLKDAMAERETALEKLAALSRRAKKRGFLPPHITSGEAARLKGVKPNTVTGWIRKGMMPGIRVGRDWLIDPEDLYKIKPGKIFPE